MGEPVRYQQRIELTGVSIIKADHKLAAVWAEALQGMRLACREIPEVAFVDIGNIWPAHGVENRDAATAVGHDRPLGGLMPMQLPDASGRQPHVDAADCIRNREILLRHLTRPAAILYALGRIIE